MNPKPAARSLAQQHGLGITVLKRDKDDAAAIPHERIAKLEYVEQMLRELRILAGDVDAAMLVYLLEMSALEAAEAIKAARLKGKLFAGRK